ncbi:hypothetical protein Tco_1281252 [Tanacetum coccineum]
MLLCVYHEFLLWGMSNRAAKTRYNTNLPCLLPKQIYSPCIVDWGLLNTMGCAEEIEEMLEIKVMTDDELMPKKVIKLKLRGRGHTLNLLEFARRLSLYHSAEINEDGFEVEENLHLSRSLASTIRSPVLRVLQKMITYGVCQRTTGYDKVKRNELWLMSMFEMKNINGYVNARWLKRKGVGSQKDSMICCGQIIIKITKKMGLLTDEGKLIDEDPAPGVPRIAMPRHPRPSIQDYMIGWGAYAPPGYNKEQQED